MKTELSMMDENEIIKLLSEKYYIVKKNDDIKDKISSEIKKITKDAEKKLYLDNPFYENQKALKKAQDDLVNKKGLDIQSDLNSYNDLTKITDVKIDEDFWNKEISNLKERVKIRDKNVTRKKIVTDSLEKISEDAKIIRKLLQEKWQKI